MNTGQQKPQARIQPRGDVERYSEVKPVNVFDISLDAISIREWHPDVEAKLPAEQVHFIIGLGEELDDTIELAVRFHSPDTLGFLIEELIAYRKKVWADAEPINPDVVIEDTYEQKKTS